MPLPDATARPIKVGLMVPVNNTTMAPELLGWLPPGSTCHTIKIPRGPGLLTPETVPAYKQTAVDLSANFGPLGIDVLAYGCTAAGFILGPEGDRDIDRADSGLHDRHGDVLAVRGRVLSPRNWKFSTAPLAAERDAVRAALGKALRRASVAKAGTDSLIASGLIKTISFIVVSPALGFLLGESVTDDITAAASARAAGPQHPCSTPSRCTSTPS